MCSALRPDMDVLEYGSGGSTTFFRWMIIYLFLDLVDKIVIVFFAISLLFEPKVDQFQPVCEKLD